MKRSLNYTGRKRIALSDVAVVVTGKDGAAAFDAILDLAKYKFPANARVYVEAYRQMEWMRFDFGSAAGIHPPADRQLNRFESPEGVLFRIRVVSPDGTPSGRLVAEADRVTVRMPHTPKGRRTLLPLAPATLQGELFRLDTSGEQPVLLVERELGGDWQAAAASPAFESLVYPQVLRSLLSELLKDGWPDMEEDSDGWQAGWALLLESLPGFSDPPEDENEYADWIDTVVEAFCRNHRMCERFNQAWSGGQ